MKRKLIAGIKEAANWTLYVILGLALLFILTLTSTAIITTTIMFWPPFISLVFVLGFFHGFFVKYKDET